MSRYDGLIIPRSYSEYINKTDAATLAQALQLGGVLAQQVSAGNNAAVTSNAVNGALTNFYTEKVKIRFGIEEKTKYLRLLRIKKGNQYAPGYSNFILSGINAFGVESAILICSINSRISPKFWKVKQIVPLQIAGGIKYTESDSAYELWVVLPPFHAGITITKLEEVVDHEYIEWAIQIENTISNPQEIIDS